MSPPAYLGVCYLSIKTPIGTKCEEDRKRKPGATSEGDVPDLILFHPIKSLMRRSQNELVHMLHDCISQFAMYRGACLVPARLSPSLHGQLVSVTYPRQTAWSDRRLVPRDPKTTDRGRRNIRRRQWWRHRTVIYTP